MNLPSIKKDSSRKGRFNDNMMESNLYVSGETKRERLRGHLKILKNLHLILLFF